MKDIIIRAYRVIMHFTIGFTVLCILAVTPILILDNGNVLLAFNRYWSLLIALGVAVWVSNISRREPLSFPLPRTTQNRLILFCIATIAIWVALTEGSNVISNHFNVKPYSEAAKIVDYYKINKISNCTERAFFESNNGATYSLCVNKIKHLSLNKGEMVILHGRKGLLGFAVDDLLDSKAPE